MEALLIDEWLNGDDAISVLDEASLSFLRQKTREIGAAQGLVVEDVERLATAVTELGRNQLRHAAGGRVVVHAIERGSNRGVEIIAGDRGVGIADAARALQGIPRSSGSLGVGLASVRDLTHEMDIDIRILEGTCIRARRFARIPEHRSEVGIYGRPYRGETRSGDHGAFVRTGDTIAAAVCDGLGHGPPARAASTEAIAVFRKRHDGSPIDILDACHQALGPTRGAVMSVARLGLDFVETASIGNVTVEIVGPRESKRFGGSSFVLGAPQPQRKVVLDRAATTGREMLLMFTDGISTRASLKDEPALLWQHPIVVAQHVLEKFGRDNDDALVLVCR